jgi:outer membrane protein assembly factor BamB
LPRVSVNLRNAVLSVGLLGACAPAPRAVPLVPEQVRSAALPEAPRVVWRNDVGNGLVAVLEAQGPALFATTTNRTVVALAQGTGRRYWLHRFAGAITTGAAVADQRLYFATGNLRGEAYALEVARGRRRWSRRIGPARLLPLVQQQHVYFATDAGQLYALNKADGAIVWQTHFSAAITTTPVPFRNRLLTTTSADSLYALDQRDGSIVRRIRIPATSLAQSLLMGDTLVLALYDGTVLGLAADTFEPRFEVKLDAPVLAAPRRIGAAIYVLSNNAVVWRISAGTAQRLVDLEGAARASFAAVGDRLVVGLLDGRLIALDSDGRKLWEQQLPRSVIVPVVAQGSALFVTMINGEVWKLE